MPIYYFYDKFWIRYEKKLACRANEYKVSRIESGGNHLQYKVE
jgi:uncharacterized membrane protein